MSMTACPALAFSSELVAILMSPSSLAVHAFKGAGVCRPHVRQARGHLGLHHHLNGQHVHMCVLKLSAFCATPSTECTRQCFEVSRPTLPTPILYITRVFWG